MSFISGFAEIFKGKKQPEATPTPEDLKTKLAQEETNLANINAYKGVDSHPADQQQAWETQKRIAEIKSQLTLQESPQPVATVETTPVIPQVGQQIPTAPSYEERLAQVRQATTEEKAA